LAPSPMYTYLHGTNRVSNSSADRKTLKQRGLIGAPVMG
jgi:hypothetical protein